MTFVRCVCAAVRCDEGEKKEKKKFFFVFSLFDFEISIALAVRFGGGLSVERLLREKENRRTTNAISWEQKNNSDFALISLRLSR
jgi:hypothetical protein